ncbi:hypothetical protein IRZ59_05600 [Pseudomonas guariconensis]|uniref:hypothetical protein n=1 Tax=Pseudomonas guariconensis TaxID=1288410 RepID=UPI0018AA904F|nr:hypothetical protein [Pseudomonas guariconensis]MBF8729915.1 hypothetical protein [Pseudomonas guariconensis]
MPDSVFGYRLLFLMLFMASSMTWCFLWLVDYSQRQPSTRTHSGKRSLAALAGFTLILACAVLEFFRFAERNILLLALICIGLVIPWGMILTIKYSAVTPDRKTRINN